ncbi:MAG: PqqD family protein [Candidatus Kapaibacterium sp.]
MKRKENFVLQNIGDEHILVPIGAEVVNLNGILVLNETAMYLWEQLSDEKSTEQLINAIMEKFDVDDITAANDVNNFIGDLKEKGMLIS